MFHGRAVAHSRAILHARSNIRHIDFQVKSATTVTSCFCSSRHLAYINVQLYMLCVFNSSVGSQFILFDRGFFSFKSEIYYFIFRFGCLISIYIFVSSLFHSLFVLSISLLSSADDLKLFVYISAVERCATIGLTIWCTCTVQW